MSVSVFDIFKIGIGPSSSHTVGPMKAVASFVALVAARGLTGQVRRVRAELFGSLALTGLGHATDTAVLLGLSGEQPDTVDPDAVPGLIAGIRGPGSLRLGCVAAIPFDEPRDLAMHRGETLPGHPNGMRFTAYDAAGAMLEERVY